MIWRSHTCFKTLAGFKPAGCFEALVALAILLPGVAPASMVRGRVEIVASKDPGVRKHSDYSGVVVWLDPISGAPLRPKSGRAEMVQSGKRFTPHILAITVGTAVDFPNLDPIFHNAFSNYDGQVFDVGLYPPGTTRTILFKKEGIVRIFCNIHPTMSAIIVVTKSPYYAISAKSGEYTIANVPAGSYRLHLFHERATEQTLSELARNVEIAPGEVSLPKIAVSETGYLLAPHKNKYGRDYPSDLGTYSGTKQ